MTVEEIYRAHKLMIYKLAHRFCCPGLEFDELVAIGNLALVECCGSYNPNLASFPTHLHSKLWWLFWNESTFVYYKKRCEKEGFDYEDKSHDPCRLLRFKQALETMTEDSTDIVRIALNAPTELIKDFPKLNKSAIRSHLLKNWKGENVQNRISEAFREIRLALKNL